MRTFCLALYQRVWWQVHARCGSFLIFLEILSGETALSKPMWKVCPGACGWFFLWIHQTQKRIDGVHRPIIMTYFPPTDRRKVKMGETSIFSMG